MGDISLDRPTMKQMEEAEKNRKEGYYPVGETAYHFKLPIFVFEVPEREKFKLRSFITNIFRLGKKS